MTGFEFKKVKDNLKKGSGIIFFDNKEKKNLFWVTRLRLGEYSRAEDATSTKMSEYAVSPALVAVVVVTILVFTLIVEVL